ncbi:MAG: HPr family phosphocarrier protein [Pseudomonadota bacterium]
MPSRSVEIINRRGLHARASAKFVEMVEAHNAHAQVRHDGQSVSGDSIMGLLMLAAHQGVSVEIETSGPDAEKLLDALDRLIADRFGEEA